MFTDTGKVLVRELPGTQHNRVVNVESECLSAAFERRWAWFDNGAQRSTEAPAQ
jgi:hypothetical protein